MSVMQISILLIVLIFLSGFFSASETALTSYKYLDFLNSKKKHKKFLKYWLEYPNKILTAILIGNNLINTFATAVFTIFIDAFLKKYFNIADSIFISTIIMTFLLLLFGEITPKIIAKNNYKKISESVVFIIYIFSKIITPIILILVFCSKLICKIFKIKTDAILSTITLSDIKNMAQLGEEHGTLDKDDSKLIKGVFNFSDFKVKEVMIPRIKVFAIEDLENLKDKLNEIINSGYSRIPIYKGELDNIIGILYVKDLVKLFYKEKSVENFEMILRTPYVVHENKKVDDLMEEFKNNKCHFAIVVNEYGTMTGIITIEDLIEEIVGEIEDEYDKEINKIRKISKNKYIVDPALDIELLNLETNFDMKKSSEYESLAGFIINATDRLPKEREVLYIDEFKIKISKVKDNRISLVIIEKMGKK